MIICQWCHGDLIAMRLKTELWNSLNYPTQDENRKPYIGYNINSQYLAYLTMLELHL
jgi:hypothetical protein